MISDKKNELKDNLKFYCDSAGCLIGVQTQPCLQQGVIAHQFTAEDIAGDDVFLSAIDPLGRLHQLRSCCWVDD